MATEPHILADVNTQCPDDSIQNENLYLKTDFRQLRIHTGSLRNNALHDLTVTELIRGYSRFLN